MSWKDWDEDVLHKHLTIFAKDVFTVYYAAKSGHAISLIATLNDYEDRGLRDFIVNQHFTEDDGQNLTPLAVASLLGNYFVVKALLTNYQIDVDKECSVKLEGIMHHGATALWCAAAAGHINIVKLLMRYGSDVNKTTKSNSTPLRAACFDGRLDIVRYLVLHGADVELANYYNNTCLMISSYKGHTDIVEFLLNSGADSNKQALCGSTALHYAAESGHVDICDILLDFETILQKNEFGLTPALTAADKINEGVVELFLNRDNLLTKEEKIDALELMGASFASDKDNYNVTKAYQYLLAGMQLRYEDPDNVIKKKPYPPVPAYDDWLESQTLQDLQAIRSNTHSIHMESLTIRERILGKKNPDVPQPIVFRGAVYADQFRFDKCERLWLYALEIRQSNRVSVERDLLRFAQLFSQMLHIAYNVKLASVIPVLSACIKELKQNRLKMKDPGPKDDVSVISEEHEQNIVTALYLVTIIAKQLKTIKNDAEFEDLLGLYAVVYELNKMNVRVRDGQTILHLAVNGVTPVDDFHTSDVCRFPCYDTVKLLLDCGADISATDCDRNTPLHTLTSTVQTSVSVDSDTLSTVEQIIKLFVDRGAHLDSVNNNGLTAAQISPLFIVEAMVKKYEVQLMSLKCLSSHCIARHKLNYKGKIPKLLEGFIEMHCGRKL